VCRRSRSRPGRRPTSSRSAPRLRARRSRRLRRSDSSSGAGSSCSRPPSRRRAPSSRPPTRRERREMDGKPERIELLVEGTVVTMDTERRVIRDGAVAVDAGRIAAVGKASDLRARYSAERTLGGPRRFVIPGLIDCHNHLAQALVRDYALEDLPNIYRIYIPCEMALDAHDAAVCAQFGITQLLRSGVTTVAETTFTEEHEDAISRTIIDTGIRAAMARGQGDRESKLASNYDQVDGRSSFHDDPARLAEDLARTEEFFRRWQAEGDGRIRPWVNNLGVP